jgi:hypothetical protein
VARWTARIEFDARLSDEQADEAAGRLAVHAGRVIRDEARHRVDVVFDLQASTLRHAIDRALRTARADLRVVGVAGSPLAAHVTSIGHGQADVGLPPQPELISPAEIGEILGVPKPRVREVTQRGDFPQPVARVRGGAIYARSAVEAFNAGWDHKFGPPSKTHARVAAELAHIPKGKPNTLQQRLRMHYNWERGWDLREDPENSASDTLSRVIEIIWQHHPDFEAVYDRSFFQPHPSRRPSLRLVTAAD